MRLNSIVRLGCCQDVNVVSWFTTIQMSNHLKKIRKSFFFNQLIKFVKNLLGLILWTIKWLSCAVFASKNQIGSRYVFFKRVKKIYFKFKMMDEYPPGGMRFLLITCLAPFRAGTVVLISAAARLYPSPVTGFPSKYIESKKKY